ncbi:MAG: hypothetical protein ACI4JY_05260, partial [Oscillospiraceae bacterium]
MKTDNAKLLTDSVQKLEKNVANYCSDNAENLYFDKEMAIILSALDCFNEIEELKASCASLTDELNKLKASDEAGKNAIELNKKLSQENAELKKSANELEKTLKKNSELVGKNEQLAETLKEANEKASNCAKAEKELTEAKQQGEALEKKNTQLSATIKENSARIEELKKLLDEKEKKISALEKGQEKTTSLIEENKRVSEKLRKAENFEEAYHREQKRAFTLETERNTLKAANEHLSRVDSENKKKIELLNKSLDEAKADNEKLTKNSVDSDTLKSVQAELAQKSKDCESKDSIIAKKEKELESVNAML